MKTLANFKCGATVSPSPLNGERGGVRGDWFKMRECMNKAPRQATPHPHSLSPLRGEGGLLVST